MSDNPNITPPDPSSNFPGEFKLTYYLTSSSGYQCPCGLWIMPGAFHQCAYNQPQQATSNPDWTVINLLSFHADRIARALERIADALEKNDGD